MKPKCPKCEKNSFTYERLAGGIYVVYCIDCGHIIGCAAN